MSPALALTKCEKENRLRAGSFKIVALFIHSHVPHCHKLPDFKSA